MDTAKLFLNGSSQAVRLPKEYRLEGDEVYVRKYGEVVYLFPKNKAWDLFVESLDAFSGDFMADGRQQPTMQERTQL
jgi:antitoxin VapB